MDNNNPFVARTEFAAALNQVASERGIDVSDVIETIKIAIAAAYHKDFDPEENEVEVELDSTTGEVQIKKDGKNVTPAGFGRIAAQTAKQVILQRIRESEKNSILDEFRTKTGTIMSGQVQRISGPIVTVNLGKAEAIMPPQEQMQNENYSLGQRLKFYIVGIKEGTHGEEIIVSRADKGLLEGLIKAEVPELSGGAVEIKAIAREAGQRSKIAVSSNQMGVDPVGSCVGQKGVRIQAVINELGSERIDIIQFSDDIKTFIAQSLSPAKEIVVTINEEEKTAVVTVPEDQLSLAIGKDGQNVRLAAKLTGYKIDIQGSGTTSESRVPSLKDDPIVQDVKKEEVVEAESTEEVKAEEAPQPVEAVVEEVKEEEPVNTTEVAADSAPVEVALPEEVANTETTEEVTATDETVEDATTPVASDPVPEEAKA
ncbi:transcription termination/antitermination protein NusA [Candidatus Curtissbacteria bacterium]|nr:transcription termination/antitermination protein NusA [Candidatus Curtissbacteria bacterium]